MKKLFTLILTASFILPVISQVVTTVPVFPATDQMVTVTFDATQGNGGLAGFTGDVYAHTGVITEYSLGSGNWKYVKTDWGVNTPETKMTRIADDLYTLEIVPNIRDYYGVPEDEEIFQLAFVFRSADSQLEGKEEKSHLIFTIYDANDNVVRQLTTSPSKGVKQLNWDLRYSMPSSVSVSGSFSPVSGGARSGRGSRGGGILVMPGNYKVGLKLWHEGELTELAKPVEFACKKLNNTTLPAKDYAENVAFAKKVSNATSIPGTHP